MDYPITGEWATVSVTRDAFRAAQGEITRRSEQGQRLRDEGVDEAMERFESNSMTNPVRVLVAVDNEQPTLWEVAYLGLDGTFGTPTLWLQTEAMYSTAGQRRCIRLEHAGTLEVVVLTTHEDTDFHDEDARAEAQRVIASLGTECP